MNATTIATPTLSAAGRAEAFARWFDSEALPRLHAEAATYDENAGGSMGLDFHGDHIEAWIDKDGDGLGLYFVGIHVCKALGLHDVKAASALSAVGTLGPAPTLLLGLDVDSPDVLAGEFGAYAELDLVDESAARALALIAARQDQAVFTAMESGHRH